MLVYLSDKKMINLFISRLLYGFFLTITNDKEYIRLGKGILGL